MATVLGINDPYHDSSFCLYSPNSVLHVELERFTRSKAERLNPIVGLVSLHPEITGTADKIAIEEGDFVAPQVRRLLAAGPSGVDQFVSEILSQEHGSIQLAASARVCEWKLIADFATWLVQSSDSVMFYGHHLCHNANAFFSSGFDRALCISLDGGGLDFVDGIRRTVYSSVWHFDRASKAIPPPVFVDPLQSFGLAWDRIRILLGFGEHEEGTVMAMAAFGKEDAALRELVRSDLLWEPYEWDVSESRALEIRSHLKHISESIHNEEDRFSLANALQNETEVRVRSFLSRYLSDYRGDLCLSGGVALNCQMTGKIKKWFPQLGHVYIPPAPYDGGISIGLAQLAAHFGPNPANAAALPQFAMGRPYGRVEIIGSAKSHGCKTEFADFDRIAKLLSDGAIIGCFSEAAESGRRALGHRSILANSSEPGMKDHINRLIKHRQWFRPFAPMVLAENVAEWFEVEPGFESPYMSFAVPVRRERRTAIPAVVHEDGTARLQTVHKDLSPTIYALLSAWNRFSGIPVLLNTSFNDREPIVNSPSDALSTLRRIPLAGVYFADFQILASIAT